MRRCGRSCSKPAQAVADGSAGASRPSRTPSSSGGWRTCLGSTPAPMTRCAPRCAWTRPAASCLGRSPHPCRRRPGGRRGRTTSTCGKGCAICSWCASCLLAGARSWSATGVPASTGRTPIKELVDVHYPDAEQVVLVQDDLNTHTPASLDAAFAPGEAKRLADRLELHYSPRHGSWLNMAEIELAVLAGQCLDRRPTGRPWRGRSPRGRRRATGPVVGSTGGSRPRTPASSSSTSTPQLRADELLAVLR
jgi:DDE superfamily endonuclease